MHLFYPYLFSPLHIGNKLAKNRICCAPQSIVGARDSGGLTQRGFSYYLEKARGGCGIVTVGETQVLDPLFHTSDPERLSRYCLLTQMIRDYGALASIELGHRGCEDYVFERGAHVEGPSGGVKEPFGVIVDEITPVRMEELANAYADACQVCLECGFDMVMLHGGHSWLLAQFLSPLFNRRTDEYGGSLENRARFPLMVLDRIRARVGDRLLLEYRMSADEIIEGGVHIGEMVEFSKLLAMRVDVIHASVGTHLDPRCYTFTSIYHENGINLPLARAIKQSVTIPVATIGGFNTPELCEQAVASGEADLVYLGRQMLADPHFAEKAEIGDHHEINTCIRCMCCHQAPPPPAFCNCSVNPNGGREYIQQPMLPRMRRRVLVLGGGPAGLSAANHAHERGHEVVLLEQSNRLGGALSFADWDVYKQDLRRYRDNLVVRTLHKDIDVRLNTRANSKLITQFNPDLVVCAIGAERVVLPIPGIETAVHAVDAYAMDPKLLGSRVIIVGGGLIGCELGMHLSFLGKHVTVLELGPELASDGYRMHRNWLLQRLEEAADCHVNARCTEIHAHGASVVSSTGTQQFFDADTVIYALGMRARSGEVDALRRSAPKRFVSVGDCLRAGKVKDAIHEGYFAVDSLY